MSLARHWTQQVVRRIFTVRELCQFTSSWRYKFSQCHKYSVRDKTRVKKENYFVQPRERYRSWAPGRKDRFFMRFAGRERGIPMIGGYAVPKFSNLLLVFLV
ncbi:hypothetical protein QYE76_019592 [Lolium multiflorum]|uniref:Uncharacterized protein n=1 Tax=Lolium multiflorum TaxID=4521 RepID=A0AAD8VR46_LOLMU|nr:hypothetical protein QYE76_019592 [Lolium multiflorum]